MAAVIPVATGIWSKGYFHVLLKYRVLQAFWKAIGQQLGLAIAVLRTYLTEKKAIVFNKTI